MHFYEFLYTCICKTQYDSVLSAYMSTSLSESLSLRTIEDRLQHLMGIICIQDDFPCHWAFKAMKIFAYNLEMEV